MSVLIEFIQETKNDAGDVVRKKGDKLRVDDVSAKSFVEKKKVAKRVDVEPVAPVAPVPPGAA
jgi:hypothetical protein